MAFIFLDLDGTLLTNGVYSDLSKSILFSLKNNGHDVCITTGRTIESLKKLKIFDDFSGYFIAENGCLIGKFKRGNIELFDDWTKKIDLYSPLIKRLANYFSRDTEVYLKRYMVTISSNEDIYVPKDFSDLISVRNTKWLDFLPNIAGKEKAAQFLQNKFNLNEDFLFFIGDASNDFALLKYVSKPGTVNNANQEIKQIVEEKNGFVSEFEETKGVQDILFKWGLI